MTQVEEQILAYLDGSLAPKEREEVLRSITDSPEGRRMLDAHVRMGDLLTHAAKPVSAPLETQRDLASKIPLLAVMLPYLAGPLGNRRATTAWFGFRSWKLAVAGLATLGIVGGGLWYALSNSNYSEPLSTTSTPSTAPLASNGPASSKAEQSSAVPHAKSIPAPSAEYHPNSVRDGKRILNNSIKNTPALLPLVDPMRKDVAPPQNVPPSEPPSPIGITSVKLQSPAAQMQQASKNLPQYRLDRHEEGYIPLRAFATLKNRFTTLPAVAFTKRTLDSSKGITSGSDQSSGFEAGLDYEISPWLSAGIHGGQANFYQIQSYSYSERSPYYQDLAERVSDAFVAPVQAYWAGVALHYEFNPQDQVRFGASAIGGFAFIRGVNASPLGMIELSSSYSLLSFLALEAAVSVDASQVNATSSTSSGSSTSSSHDPLGLVTAGPNREKLTTTSLGGRIGIVIHP